MSPKKRPPAPPEEASGRNKNRRGSCNLFCHVRGRRNDEGEPCSGNGGNTGLEALRKYLEKLDAEASSSSASKAAKRLMDDLYMRKTLYRVKECDVEHPKLALARRIVCEQLEGNPDSRVIVFTNYRDSAEMVVNALSEVSGIVPVRFVGQGSRHKDKGLTQKQQVEILDRFRAGEYNVLVATSVAEEGLDIPATDLVLFYEPVPSEIRSIQRKGRTGRQHKAG